VAARAQQPARWARFGRPRALPTERRDSVDRPVGYKVARLVADPSSPDGGFLGLTVGGLYASESVAGCEVLDGSLPPPRRWWRRTAPEPHTAPELRCSCGFYAFTDVADAAELLSTRPPVGRLFGTALLEVDLAGTVVEFDRGYRGARQRVLGVELPHWCVPCAAEGAAEPARRVLGLAGSRLAAGLEDETPRLSSVYRLAVIVHHAALLQRLDGRAALRPVCDRHTRAVGDAADGADGEVVVLELPELAARLGTEVRWLDDERFDVRAYVEAVSWLPPAHRKGA
jgi:hypothetical protein